MRPRKSIKYRGFTYVQATAEELFNIGKLNVLKKKYAGKLDQDQMQALEKVANGFEDFFSDLSDEVDKIDQTIGTLQLPGLEKLPRDLAKFFADIKSTVVKRAEGFCSLFSDIETFGRVSEEFESTEG